MHQIRKTDVISINGSPCHCRRLKTGTGFCTVIRGSISIGKPQKCRSVPFRISCIKRCCLRSILFFDPEKILSNHPIRFIPGYSFEFPASFFSDPLHRIQDPVFVINILSGGRSFGTQSPTLSRKIPAAFYRHKLSLFYISIDRTSRRTDITADFFYYSLIHAVSPINVSMFIRTFYYNKLLFSFLSIFQISVFLSLHDLKVHDNQKRTCQYPCRRGCQTDSHITSKMRSDQRCPAPSDKFCNPRCHRKQSISHSLNSVSIQINNNKRQE